MEPRIRERFNSRILGEAARRYGVYADQVHKLASAESFIYEFVRNHQPFILRIAHSLRRNVDLIRGEVDWINYLDRGGASVSKAVLSVNESLVEPIDDGEGGSFLATAFVKAPGRAPSEDDESPEYFERYGREIGRMHRLTKAYEPANEAWRRPHWDDNVMQDMISFLPPSERVAQRKLEEMIAKLRLLPRKRDAYGLVHQDAHRANYFIDDCGTFTFFDFDDCAYTWFANDVAIVLFYGVTGKEDVSAFAHLFLSHFLRGYACENRFDEQWFAQMPHFLKLRELELYAVIHRSFDVNHLTHPWVARFMERRKERIEKDVPYIDFDFATLHWQ